MPGHVPFVPFQALQNADGQRTGGVAGRDFGIDARKSRLLQGVPEDACPCRECAQNGPVPRSSLGPVGMHSGQKRLDDIVGAPAEAAQTDDRLAGEETIQGLFGNPRKVTGVAVGLAAQDYTGVFIGGHKQPHSAVCRRSGRGGALGWTRRAIKEMRQLRRRADDLPIALGRIVAAGGSGWLRITGRANVHP